MRFQKILGGLLFIFGVFSLISSQSGITGNVISDDMSTFTSVLGLVAIIGGLVVFISNNHYGNIAGLLYQKLIEKKAYGKRTEKISVLVNSLSKKNFSLKQINHVIEGEIKKKHLQLSGKSVSLKIDAENLGNIINLYGALMPKEIVYKIGKLKSKKN